MSAKTQGLAVPRRGLTLPRAAAGLLVAGLLASGVAISIAVSREEPRPPVGPANDIVREAAASVPAVTGTGPGLVYVAERQATSQPKVTGTGPGLVYVAEHQVPAAGPSVTGTGPGLIQIAQAEER